MNKSMLFKGQLHLIQIKENENTGFKRVEVAIL